MSADERRQRKRKAVADIDAEDGEVVQKNDLIMQSTEDVCRMYLQGYSMLEISKAVSLSMSVIRSTIEDSRRVWLERHNQSLSDLIAEQIAKIDRVEASAWESYELSRKAASEVQASSGTNNNGQFASRKTTRRKQHGSSDFLNLVLSCIKQRSQLLGLNNKKDDDGMRHNSMLVVVNSPEEARAIHDYQQFQKMVDGTVVDKSDLDGGVTDNE